MFPRVVRACAAAWLVGVLCWADQEFAHAQEAIRLRLVTPETGIRFVHTDGSAGKYYIVENVSAGLATFDYDGDGRIDIYFLNGAPLEGAKVVPPPRNALYRNLGGFRFADVTDQAGVGDEGFGLGVTAGDYDNDGDPDLYLNNFGPNKLYRNRGDGTFEDVTERAGVVRGERVGAGTCFFDMDADGDLDLFVANYVKFSYDMFPKPRTQAGFPIYRGPREYPPETNTLFRNNGDGTFTDVSLASGIAAHPGTGMGMICADFDHDGDTDVFVLNDVGANSMFRNEGSGRFEEVGLMAGTAYNCFGRPTGSMGVDCGDYDNDGRLDFFMTCYQTELPCLYHNLGGGLFEDAIFKAGGCARSLPHVKWGCGLVDLDNDGWKDIFFACGHLQDNIERFDDTSAYEARPILLRNLGNGRFVDLTDSAGDGLQYRSVGRGVAFDDLDDDGRVDVVILNSRRPATVLRNESPTRNHYLQVRLQGVKTNRDGVGAHVLVAAGGLRQISEVHSGRGYQGHFGSRLHFGLGPHDRIDRIEVHWIGGGCDILENVLADRCITLVEGAQEARNAGR